MSENKYLIIIENGEIRTVCLESRPNWTFGRISRTVEPDIGVNVKTVSREQGRFEYNDGIWFYIDSHSLNPTYLNYKKIMGGMAGRANPVMLNDGDVLIFGSGDSPAINKNTVWVLYTDKYNGREWEKVNTVGMHNLIISNGSGKAVIDPGRVGTVERAGSGMIINLGSFVFMTKDLTVSGIPHAQSQYDKD